MKWIDDILNAEAKMQRSAEATKLRKEIVGEIDSLFRREIPALKKGKSRYWTTPLNKHAYFYLTMEFPKWIQVDNDSFKMYYAIVHVDDPPSELMYVPSARYVTFPYKLHKTALALSGRSTNHLRWSVLKEGRNIFYGDDEQITYALRTLMPLAVGEIAGSLRKAQDAYGNSEKKPPTIPGIVPKS